MSISVTQDITAVAPEQLNALYDEKNGRYELFKNSYITVAAVESENGSNSRSGNLAGAVRVISEGVETALLVDLKAAPGYGSELKSALIREAEKKLAGRRVMVYGSREDLEMFEELGYGRCKNAWTYFRTGMKESDFLPAGYRFENEFTVPER